MRALLFVPHRCLDFISQSKWDWISWFSHKFREKKNRSHTVWIVCSISLINAMMQKILIALATKISQFLLEDVGSFEERISIETFRLVLRFQLCSFVGVETVQQTLCICIIETNAVQTCTHTLVSIHRNHTSQTIQIEIQ